MLRHKATERNILTVLAQVVAQRIERGDNGNDDRRLLAQQINKLCNGSEIDDISEQKIRAILAMISEIDEISERRILTTREIASELAMSGFERLKPSRI